MSPALSTRRTKDVLPPRPNIDLRPRDRNVLAPLRQVKRPQDPPERIVADDEARMACPLCGRLSGTDDSIKIEPRWR